MTDRCPSCGFVLSRRAGDGLTPNQLRAFTFIADQIEANGVPPSYSEIAKHMGWKTRSNVQRVVVALVARGAVTMRARTPRSLRVVRAHG